MTFFINDTENRFLQFIDDLMNQFCQTQGSYSHHLTLYYWTDSVGNPWKLVFRYGSKSSLPSKSKSKLFIYCLPISRRLFTEDEAIGYIKRVDNGTYCMRVGKQLLLDKLDESNDVQQLLAVLYDLSVPCKCLAQDASVLNFFPIQVRCCCGVGILAAAQRHAQADSGRCPFSGLSLGSLDDDKMSVVHPAWNQWIAKWHNDHPIVTKENEQSVQLTQ